MAHRKLPPVHPGEILLEEFLSPLGISQYRLTKETSVPPRRINEIVRGSRSISADAALRLARYFGTSERFWLNLQALRPGGGEGPARGPPPARGEGPGSRQCVGGFGTRATCCYLA
jgi:addiction module HigA family antidote